MTAERPRSRMLANAAACAILAGWYVLLYGDSTQHFFHWDDFRLLGIVENLSISGPFDLIRIFRPGPTSTFFYRPLSEAGYFWLLQSLFGHDSAPYHAVQLIAGIVNAVLAYALASTILHSRAAGLGTALLYAAAPGHVIAVNWNAAYSVTGTAFWYFATLLAWLRLERARGAVCTVLFAAALLSGEAAVTLPLILTLSLFLEKDPPLRQRFRALVPLYVMAAIYAAAKAWYFRFGLPNEFPDAMHRAVVLHYYGPTFSPTEMLHSLGFYCACAFSWLYGFIENVSMLKVIAVVWLFALVLSTAEALRSVAARRVAFGLSFFVIALGPLLTLPNHRYMYLIGIAAFGSSLAVVAALRAIPRVGPWLTVAAVGATLAVQVTSALPAVREGVEFRFMRDFQAGAAGWLSTVDRQARRLEVDEVIVPASPLTTLVFRDAAAHRIFYGATYEVRVVEKLPTIGTTANGAVVQAVKPWRPGEELPGQDRRWDWLR